MNSLRRPLLQSSQGLGEFLVLANIENIGVLDFQVEPTESSPIWIFLKTTGVNLFIDRVATKDSGVQKINCILFPTLSI